MGNKKYVLGDSEHPITEYHLDGVTFEEYKMPPRVHRCWAQTRLEHADGSIMELCPCGANRKDIDSPWEHKNLRWKQRRAHILRLRRARRKARSLF